MPQSSRIATRELRIVDEANGPFVGIPYSASFDAVEFNQICRGLIPRGMEDKWFIFFEDPWLYFHRSWTGHLVYRVRFEVVDEVAKVTSAQVLDDKDKYRWSSDTYEAMVIDFLIQGFLLGRDVPFPVPKTHRGLRGIYQHHIVGRGAREIYINTGRFSEWFRKLIRRLRHT